MKIFYGFNQIKKFKKPVLILGVFDGLHLAHRKILKAAIKKAKTIKGTSIVLTFWPHLQKKELIYSLQHRLNLIKELGIDIAIIINFNANFARLSAEDFVKDILVKRIGIKFIYIGKNFRFGRYAFGDVRLLKKLSSLYNFKVKIFDIMKIKNQPISSTYIRQLIKRGEIQAAQKLLTRPVSVLGTVVKGKSLAGELGFPTANIDPHHEILPPSGVYATKIIFQNKKLNGICYIGPKPTFILKGTKEKRQQDAHIEVHIFNFHQSIYGKDLQIHFIKKIREAKKFATPEDLARQVKKDIIQAKKLLFLP
jgi:riboflavin kinase/FMN adenylyltransferase